MCNIPLYNRINECGGKTSPTKKQQKMQTLSNKATNQLNLIFITVYT